MTDISKEAVDALLQGLSVVPAYSAINNCLQLDPHGKWVERKDVKRVVSNHITALRAALDEAEATAQHMAAEENRLCAEIKRLGDCLVKAEAQRDATNALLRDGLLTVQTGRNEPLVIWSETVAAHLGAKP